jgi:hypothetical protein
MSVGTQREEELNHAHGQWILEIKNLVLYLAANFMPLEFSRVEY